MKIKHWQGYGSLTAKKISHTHNTDDPYNPYDILEIDVIGDHEWGIETTDHTTIYHWLLSKFDKTVKSEYQIISVKLSTNYSVDPYTCHYRIKYKPTDI